MENSINKTNGKLPFRVKLCYSVGGFGKSLPTVMLMAYSLYFYNNLCGIDPYIVSAVVFVARIWDFANDPLMAILVDRTHAKVGRCRVWLKYFSLPAGIAFALCFIMPDFAATGKVIWFIVFYVLQDMIGTATLVPINTMLGRLTTVASERAAMSGMNGYFGILANLVGGSLTMPLVGFFGQGSEVRGFAYVGVIYGALFALSTLIVFWGSRGYDAPGSIYESGESGEEKEHTPAGESIKALVTNVPWLFCVGMYFVIMVSVGIASASGLYYFEFNIGSTNLYSTANAFALAGSIISYAILKPAVKRLGCARFAIVGALIMALGYFVRFALNDATPLIIIGGYVVGTLGQSITTSVIMLMVLDCNVYGEWKTGVSHEAVLMSGYSVSYKIGSTIATPIAGVLLGMVPWMEGAASQEQSVLNLFYYEVTLFPAIGALLAAFFAFMFLRYEKRFPEMRHEIAARSESK